MGQVIAEGVEVDIGLEGFEAQDGTLEELRQAMQAGSKMSEDQFSYLISGVGCDSSVGGVSLAVRAIGDSFDSAKEDRSLDNCSAVCGASSCDGVGSRSFSVDNFGLLSGIAKFPEFSIHNQIHNPVSRVACNISVGTICSEFSGRTERCASVALSGGASHWGFCRQRN